MKRISIKLRITLFIAIIITVLSVGFMMLTVRFASAASEFQLKDMLRDEVNNLYNQFEFKELGKNENPNGGSFGKEPPADTAAPPVINEAKSPSGGGKEPMYELIVPENIEYQPQYVNLYVHSTLKKYTVSIGGGALPEGIVFDKKWKTEEIITIDEYYLYVRFIDEPGASQEGIWICGTVDTSTALSAAYNTTVYALILIPVIVVLATVFAYLATKRAFKPVAKITEAAASIAGSKDLSQRLNMGEGKGEIQVLASTFDGMLESIERNFEKEKQFTSDASHELRTPVAVIMAQSEFALDAKATEEDRIESIKSIHRQSLKMNKLLSELLSLARSDNKTEVMEKENFDICELAEIVVEELKPDSDAKGIKTKVVSSAPITVNADHSQIMRVLINLIDNAIKYGKEGGNVTVSIEDKGDGHILCSVEDDGIGISEENLKQVWNRFYRADTARTATNNGSSGLGLSMVKSIIEAHGGKVSAESVLGEGSVFTFEL